MGHNRLVFCSREVTPLDLRSYIEGRGAEWQELDTFEQGYVETERGDGYVWVSLYPITALDDEFLEERAELERRVGAPIRGIVDIQYGRGPSTPQLAERVMSEIAERWSGVPDEETA